MHILFDRGLLGVDSEYRVHVSPKIKEAWHNGVVYYSHQGKILKSMPADLNLRPSKDELEWHMHARFQS